MIKLARSSKLQSSVLTRQRLRWIVACVLISLVALLVIGIIISLLSPDKWNPLLVSLFLNIISGLIGAAVAILTAIFVVQKFLDDRNKEEYIRNEKYKAKWTIVQYQFIHVWMYNIVHVCLFVAFGKDRYLQLGDHDFKDMPESIGDFIPAFTLKVFDFLEEQKGEDAKKRSSQQDNEIWSSYKQAFNSEIAAKTSCNARDIDVLLHALRGYDVNLRRILYLIQPFMLDKMGMAFALLELSYDLRLTMNTIRQHMAIEIKNNPEDKLQLCDAVTSRFLMLGLQAVKVREMIFTNQEGDLYAVSDSFKNDTKVDSDT